MSETRPTGEQLRFVSAATGEHILDTYLEAAEKGGRTLADMLSDIYDPITGLFRADYIEFRITSARQFQFRVGDFPDTTSGWQDVASNPSLFGAKGAWAATTVYAQTDIVTYTNSTYYCLVPHTSTSTFDATKWAVMSDGTALNTATSTASTSATAAAASAATAATSATTATTKAAEAVTSANAAAASATTAGTQAATATTKATEANTSANSAATSLSNATASASTASTAATTATSKATEASSSASSASNSATTATTQATLATSKATDATNAASAASADAATALTRMVGAETAANASAASAALALSREQGANNSRLAAEIAAASSAAGAATSTAKASEAAGSAAAIEATFGNAASVALQAQNAQAAASLAQGYAASASSVVQQDLSGVEAQALHRSPNAITAQFIYDTSKDSDGGAWTEKCQQTSWYNEALAGKWLGAWASEFEARHAGATLGLELVTNGSFAAGSTGWTLNTGWSVANGVATKAAGTTDFARFTFASALTVGKTYAVQFDVLGATAGTLSPRFGGGTVVNGSAYGGNGTFKTVLTAASGNDRIEFVPNSTFNGSIDNISVREVTALTTTSNDYFQLSTDGKFYRLYKNLLSRTEQFDNAAWGKVGVVASGSRITANSGTSAAYAEQAVFNVPATTVTISVVFANTAGRHRYVWVGDRGVVPLASATFDLNAVSVVGKDPSVTASAVTLSDGSVRCAVTYVRTSVGSSSPQFALAGSTYTSDRPSIAWTGGEFLDAKAQLELGSTATTYEAKAAEGTTSEIFRGNKGDFPRLAAIVAENSNVNIYDLTEPGRPMWMRFVSNAQNYAIYGNTNALSMLNGVMALGTSAGYNPVDFAKDSSDIIRIANQGFDRKYPQIALRNAADGALFTNTTKTPIIVNNNINAVAMTVLPDAPIDPATGLRVPTIAVATGGGVSVIKHNGTVVSTASANSFHHVYIDRNILMYSRIGDRWVAYALNPGSLGASFAQILMGTNPDEYQSANPVIERFSGRSAPIRFISPTVKRKWNNEALPTRGLNMSVAPTYNTGWMTGDIRRCFLSDTGVGSLAGGTPLNDDFSAYADTTALLAGGWSLGGNATASEVTVSGSEVAISNADNSNDNFIYRNFATVAGQLYKATVSSQQSNTQARTRIRNGDGNIPFGFATNQIGAINALIGTNVIYFTALSSVTSIAIGASNGTGVATFQDVNIEAVAADVSYRAAAANINGTLTRAQLASGTSLVGYSGFSASNYLREPYSADLDFGTGEWTASAWVNVPAELYSTYQVSFPNVGADLNTTPTTWSVQAGWVNNGDGSYTATASNGAVYRAGPASGVAWRVTFTVTGYTSGVVRANARGGPQVNVSANGTYSYIVGGTGADGILYLAATNFTGTISGISMYAVGPAIIGERTHTSGPRIRLGVTGLGYLTAEAFDGTTTRTVTTTAAYNTATWLKARVSYTTDGSLTIRVNGREVAATRGNPLLTLNNTSAVLTIGNSYALDAPFPGTIALLKLGATVPTPEQATFMYEQEKQLFRANAQSVLPDTGAVVDMAYDDATDRWVAVSAANESYWTGLVRNTVTPVPAGSYTKIVATSGIELAARSTTNPGVDVTIPAYGLREELVKRAEAAARLGKELSTFDYVGGFTANTTNGNTAITSASTITYPASYIGARISGSGIPTNATIVAVSGSTLYLSAAATATATGVSITFLDFELPVGMEAKTVFSAGVQQREGATAAFTRLYDGFIETIRFGTAPGATALVTIQAQRISQ